MAAMFRSCWMSFRLKLRNKDFRILHFGLTLEKLLTAAFPDETAYMVGPAVVAGLTFY